MKAFLNRLRVWLISLFAAAGSEEEEAPVIPADTEEAPLPAREKRDTAILYCIPGSFSDARRAAEALQRGRIVMVNLESVDKKEAARIQDFLAGAVYLLKGNIQALGGQVLLCTPETVRVEHDDFSFHAEELLRWKGPEE